MADLDEKIPYEEYYRGYIGKAKRTGEQLLGLCPFHDDKSQSFSVNVKTGQWSCFAKGGCGAGNVITFHAKKHGLEEKEAYRELCKLYGVENGNGASRPGSFRPAAPAAARTDKTKTIPLETLDLFKTIPLPVLEYLKEKRGWSSEIIEKHQVGYNGELRFRPGNIGPERITIPVFDERAELVNIRSYQPGAPENKLMSWSTGNKKKGTWRGYGEGRLFPLKVLDEARSQGRTVYLVEGEPDCLCGLSQGLWCVTNTGGALGWKDEWNALFRGLRVRIAYDNDESGQAGTEKVCKHLPSFAESVEVITWPEWMGEKEDLTDWFVRHQRSVAEFEGLSWKRVEGKAQGGGDDAGESVKRRIRELNERHAVVLLGGKCLIINEFRDPTFDRPNISFSNPENFKNYYANERYFLPAADGKMKALAIGKLWFESEDRRQYEGIVFEPEREIAGHYNLYRGFAEEPEKGDWSLFYNHIKTVIANNNVEVFRYILAWLAHLFQYPGGKRPGVSIVLRGKQGTGKGCFASQIGKICGSHFLHITKSQQLTGKFNSHLKDALFVFCDEGVWAGDKQAEGALKAMITEDYLAIEPKGKDVFMVKNHVRLLIASNNSWVVPAGMEERRFCVLDVPNTHIQDHVYFKAIFQQMDNGGRAAMLHDLLELDISDFDLYAFPRTDALFDQVQQSFDAVAKFWFEKLMEGTELAEYAHWTGEVSKDKLYAEFKEFCRSIGERYLPAKNMFGRKLREVCPSMKNVRQAADTYGKREWALRYGAIEECRKQFSDAVGMEIKWSDVQA